MPDAFSAVPRACERAKSKVFAACERMRNDTVLRDAYVELAERVEKELRVRVEAYDGSASKADLVGEASDCDARDETTHEIVLEPNAETPMPVLIAPDSSRCFVRTGFGRGRSWSSTWRWPWRAAGG